MRDGTAMREREVISLLTSASGKRVEGPELDRVRAFFIDRVASPQRLRRHPLGFFYIVEKLDENISIRYHLWPSGWGIPPSQVGGEVHDHIFKLSSLVLMGTLRNENFTFSDAANGEYDVLTVAYGQDASGLQRTGERANLSVDSIEEIAAGTIYHVPTGVIHRTRPVSDAAVTLVIAGSASELVKPRVLVRHGEPPPAQFDRSLISTSEQAKAREILEKLAEVESR
jgi:hypothetical protein